MVDVKEGDSWGQWPVVLLNSWVEPFLETENIGGGRSFRGRQMIKILTWDLVSLRYLVSTWYDLSF
jgi:hypothetical protein